MSSHSSQTRFGVVLFQSVQGALAAEKRLLDAGVPHKLIAVPRHISSSCGFCLRFSWPDRDLVEELLHQGGRLGVEAIREL